MSQTPQQPPVIGQVANGYRWDGTQWIPLPQVGQIVNGHQWNGTQWIPLPQVGQIVNGHQWNGTQWIPLPQVGQIVNGHQWNGTQWIPLPQVGQIVNGHQWNGTQWIPLPQVGQIVNGHQWNGTQWVPLPAGPAQAPVAQPGSTSGAPDRHAAVIGQIAAFAQAWQLSFDQVGDRITLTRVVAERKAFLSTARLEYLATITLDAAGGEIRFSEMLKESGAGLTSGGGDDGDFGSTTGFGFQKTSYNTRTDTIADSIEEQARSLGAKYANQFPYHEIRTQLNRIAEAGGYGFRYGVR